MVVTVGCMGMFGWHCFRLCDGVLATFFFLDWIVVWLCHMIELLVAGDAVACMG